MDPETVKALITAAQNLGLVALGAIVSWFATKAAEERKARREDDLAAKREKRTHLQERLALQRAALTEYRPVLAKWVNDWPSYERSSITGTLERKRTEEIESHADAAAISRQISDAFDSSAFGDQAGLTILGLVDGRKDPTVALVMQLAIGKCMKQMRLCIEALSEELGLPKLKVKPEPFFPPDEFTRQAKRFMLKDHGERGGLDPKTVDEILEKAGLGEAPPHAISKVKPEAKGAEKAQRARVEPVASEPVAHESEQQAAEDEAHGVEEAVEAERQAETGKPLSKERHTKTRSAAPKPRSTGD